MWSKGHEHEAARAGRRPLRRQDKGGGPATPGTSRVTLRFVLAVCIGGGAIRGVKLFSDRAHMPRSLRCVANAGPRVDAAYD